MKTNEKQPTKKNNGKDTDKIKINDRDGMDQANDQDKYTTKTRNRQHKNTEGKGQQTNDK